MNLKGPHRAVGLYGHRTIQHLLVFAESKKRTRDEMRGTQVRWLEAALRCGCSVADFQVVEWELAT